MAPEGPSTHEEGPSVCPGGYGTIPAMILLHLALAGHLTFSIAPVACGGDDNAPDAVPDVDRVAGAVQTSDGDALLEAT